MAGTTDPRRMRAFRTTVYCAGGAVAQVGRRCPALDSMLHQQAGAFIGAWNPAARLAPLGRNLRAGRALQDHLRAVPYLTGVGQGRGWREEHWFAVMDPRRAAVLARRFRQAAIVTLRRGQPARLRLL